MIHPFPIEKVLELYQSCESHHIRIWLDGGWGVDALLEKQTRDHDDLDVVVEDKNLQAFVQLLRSMDYFEVQKADNSAWNFVLSNNDGLEIDIHVIHFDKDGHGIYGPKARGIYYPAYAFQAMGKLNDVFLNCLSAEYQLESHSGYVLRDKDFQDIAALCKKFDLKKPI